MNSRGSLDPCRSQASHQQDNTGRSVLPASTGSRQAAVQHSSQGSAHPSSTCQYALLVLQSMHQARCTEAIDVHTSAPVPSRTLHPPLYSNCQDKSQQARRHAQPLYVLSASCEHAKPALDAPPIATLHPMPAHHRARQHAFPMTTPCSSSPEATTAQYCSTWCCRRRS